MESILGSSLKRFRSMVLDPSQESAAATLTLAELDTLCSPAPEHVEEIILLCLLAARQYPAEGLALGHVPWILSAMAINYPDRLAPFMLPIAGLLEAPAEQTRELAVQLTGDWWQRGHRELFPYLLKALRDPSPQVVRAALQRLRQCSGPQALELLEHCQRAVPPPADAGEEEASTPPVDEATASQLYACFSQMALLLAKQGFANEIMLRGFFEHLRTPLARAVLPGPVREWLAKPHGKLDDLLAGYTQQELSDFR